MGRLILARRLHARVVRHYRAIVWVTSEKRLVAGARSRRIVAELILRLVILTLFMKTRRSDLIIAAMAEL